jgi:hypothetical protein
MVTRSAGESCVTASSTRATSPASCAACAGLAAACPSASGRPPTWAASAPPRCASAALARSQRIERGVHRDPIQPGEEIGAAVERREPPIRPHERLLGGVIGVAVVAEDMERCCVHASLVAPDQPAEGVAVAPACAVELEVILLVGHPRAL